MRFVSPLKLVVNVQMNKSSKPAVLILTHALFAFGGAVLGYFAHEKLASSVALVDEMALVSRAATYAEIQREQGSDNDYKQALLAYLRALERRVGSNGFFTERMNAVDKTLTFIRLARVAEKEGNQAEVTMYSKNALASCVGTGWKDCSRERLWSVVALLDGGNGARVAP